MSNAAFRGQNLSARGRVLLGESVLQACLEQSHLTAKAQGALFGDVNVNGSSSLDKDVAVWNLQMTTSGLTGNEQTEEEFVAAQLQAEAMSEQVSRSTKVVGWYTSSPSEVTEADMRLQLQYQENFADYCVALVFGRAANAMETRQTVTAFRTSVSRGTLVLVTLKVEVVPLCSLVAQDCFLQRCLTPTVRALRQVITDMQQARHQKTAGHTLKDNKMDVAAELQMLCGQYEGLCLMLESKVPVLAALLSDAQHNSQVLEEIFAKKAERSSQEGSARTPSRPSRPAAPAGNHSVSARPSLTQHPATGGLAPSVGGPAVSAEAETTCGGSGDEAPTQPHKSRKKGLVEMLNKSRAITESMPSGVSSVPKRAPRTRGLASAPSAPKERRQRPSTASDMASDRAGAIVAAETSADKPSLLKRRRHIVSETQESV